MTPTSTMRHARTWAAFAAVILPAAVLMVTRLGAGDVSSGPEARIVGVAREMLRTGEYFTPEFNHEPRLAKPPLPYWLAVLACRVRGGYDVGTARLAAVGCGLLAVAAVFWVTARQWGPLWGALAGLILATTFPFLVQSRLDRIDIFVASFATVALAIWYVRYSDPPPRRPRLWEAAAWVVLALGFLSKGPAVILSVVVPMVVWPFLGPKPVSDTDCAQHPSGRSGNRCLTPLSGLAPRRRLPRWVGPLIFLLVVAPWPVGMLATQPNAVHVWWEEMGTRSDPGIHPQDPLYYYPLRLPVLLFPWSVLALAGAVSLFIGGSPQQSAEDGASDRGRWRRFVRWARAWAAREPLGAYALLWLVGAMVCWSFIGQKKSTYLVPAVPAGALLAAVACRRWYERPHLLHARAGAFLQAVVHLALAVAAVWFIAQRPVWWPWTAPVAAVNLLAAALVVRTTRPSRVSTALAAALAANLVSAFVLMGVLVPHYAREEDPLALARQTRQLMAQSPDARLYLVNRRPDLFIYGADCPYPIESLIIAPGPHPWQPVLEVARRPAILVVPRIEWPGAPPALRRRFRVVERQTRVVQDAIFGLGSDENEAMLLLTNIPALTQPFPPTTQLR